MPTNESTPDKPEYVVSFTPYEAIVDSCHLKGTLEKLPENAQILDIGSGLQQEFADGLKKSRPDCMVISLDPSLSISKSDPDYKIAEAGSYLVFNTDIGISANLWQTERLKDIKGDLAIAADAKASLPFKDNCLDLIVDNIGPGLYLVDMELQKYLEEVYRVLKHGGKAHISSFLRITNATNDPVYWKEKASVELRNLFKDIIPDESIEVFYNNYSAGVIISK